MASPRIIKKYGNRRLYDTESSSYVNLERVAELVREGEDVEVVDAKTGEDLTRHVLSQIIVEGARDPEGGPPLEFLRELVRSSDRAQRDFLHWYLGTAAEAWKRMQQSWRDSTPWPSLQEQREAWANFLDPLGAVRAMVKAARGESAVAQESEEQEEEQESSSADAAELADLRRRLELLERRLGGDAG